MWTSFRSCYLLCTVLLAVEMLVSSSEVIAVETYVPVVGLPCCPRFSAKRVQENITECYEQRPRVGCNSHAFWVKTASDKEWCVSPTARWLQRKIKQGKLQCPPELS